MSPVLLLAAQTALAEAPPSVLPIDFDLARARPAQARGDCSGSGGDEILVCGVRRSGTGPYPFAAMARLFAQGPIRAEMNLGSGATGRAFLQQQELDRGAVSNRVMIGIRWPF